MPDPRVKSRERNLASVTPDGSLDAVPPTATVSVATRLWDRFGHLVRELGRFGVVGGVAFAVDFAVFNVLLHRNVESLTAKTISTVIAATVAFIGNRFWTWRHRENSGLCREYLLYFFFNAVGLGIGLACLAIGHYGLGQLSPIFQTTLADNISGLLIGTAFGTLFRFWTYRRFVFVGSARSVTGDSAAVRDPLDSGPADLEPHRPG